MEISIDRPRLTGETVDCVTFGVIPNNPDNTAALQAAFDYAAAHPGIRLTLKKGVYRFATEKRIVLQNATDVEFDGGGAECRFAAKSYFDVFDCERVVFRNLYMDWDWEGAYRLADMVRCVDKGDGYLDFEHFEVAEAQDVPWFTLNQYDPETFTPGCEDGIEYWNMPGEGDIKQLEHLGGNLTRLHHNGGRLTAIKPGEVYCLRYETYGPSALVIFRSHHVTVEDVTVWSVPGMAFYIGKGSSHYHFDRCTVTIRPGTNRHMSATVDSMHIGNSGGYGIVERCDFAYAGDDAINIHDNVGLIIALESTRTLVVQKRLDCAVGDEIGVMRPDASDAGLRLTVAAQEEYDQQHWRLTFAEDLPAEVVADGMLYNQKYNSAYYIFRNNYFHENRARGLLLGSSHGLVENNTIYKTQGPAVLIEVDIAPGWSEGTGVDGLILRNNRFVECNVNEWWMKSGNTAVIEMLTMLPGGLSPAPVFRNVRIEDNLFSDMPSPAVSVRSAENVRIAGNTFEAEKPRRRQRDNRGGVIVECASNVVIEHNTVVKSSICDSLLTVYGEAVAENTMEVDR